MKQSEPFEDDVRRVHEKARRMARARRAAQPFFRHLVAGSALGWAFILPTLGGVLLGRMVGRLLHRPGMTLIGLLLGLVMGGFSMYLQVRRGLRHEDEKREDKE